ncbi:hypothetical protein CIK87_03435, partial [Prevotella sp. P5-64]
MFGMSVAASAQQTFTHITIKSGFNQDVICEDKDRITETTTQSDAPDLQGIDGSGFAFFTTSVQTNGAMCGDDGLFKSSRTGATFKVMPTQLNALVLKGTKKTTIAGNSVVIPGSVVQGELVFEPEFGISDSRFSCYARFPTGAYYICPPNNMDGKMQNCKVQMK